MPSRAALRVDRSVRVPAQPVSVSDARRFVTELLADSGCGCALGEDAELMLSELVTNAVRHQRDGAIGISAVLRGPALRVSVTDESADVPLARGAGTGAASGRGLFLVEQLATRWGWARLTVGKVVWFEAVCVCRLTGAA